MTFRPDLNAVKARYAGELLQRAEAARARHLTPGTGKAYAYQRKREQLQVYRGTGAAGAFLVDEARLRGISVDALAGLIERRAEACDRALAAIDAEELRCRSAIAAAGDVATARRALNSFDPEKRAE